MNKALKSKQAWDPKNPNASLNLDFNYFKLKEKEEFERYLNLLEETAPQLGIADGSDRQFFFELYRMIPVYQDRYPGLEGTPRDFVGVRFKETEPVPLMKTRIHIKDARIMNQQIENAHSVAGHGKYYLLVQPNGLNSAD